MNLSFTKEYYPSIEELTEDQIAAARDAIVTSLRPAMPDVDLAPATPTGDFVITPLAVYRAAAEVANSRLMSDLDLGNVANGLIYSCKFVRAYLGNFAVYDVENLKASGLVRLTFSSASALELPRTIRFRFGSEDDWTLKVVDPDATYIQILASGSSHNGQPDTYILAQTTANTWAVDVPVEGVLSAPIVAGTAGTATEIPTTLVGLTSAIDFASGLPSASLPDLARMARKVAFSLTAGSRASTKALIYRNWPESNMVSPVVPGDVEMQRIALGSAMALQAPSVDVYFRSNRDMQRATHSFRLAYVQPDVGDKVFRGLIPTLHRASRVVSIEWSGTTTESLVTSHTVFSKSDRADLYGSLHCGTRYESLYVELVPELDGLDVPLIPLSDDGGQQYAIFTVVYDSDPLLESVSSLLESPEYRPAGVDVLVKSGPLVLFDDIEILYTKKQGVKTLLNVARQRIVDYLRTAGHPDDFRVTEIHDIMRNAGADKIINLGAAGNIQVSAATRLFRATITDPLDPVQILDDWSTESDLMYVVPFVDIDAVQNPYSIVDGEISPGGPADAWAATNRTVRYAVDPENVRFVETS
jgi:hypothetical protein